MTNELRASGGATLQPAATTLAPQAIQRSEANQAQFRRQHPVGVATRALVGATDSNHVLISEIVDQYNHVQVKRLAPMPQIFFKRRQCERCGSPCTTARMQRPTHSTTRAIGNLEPKFGFVTTWAIHQNPPKAQTFLDHSL